MVWKTPKIDNRSGEDMYRALAEAVRERLGVDADRDDPLARAMLRIFSRYGELIIERLNKSPDKHHDVFLDTLNLSRTPPVAAGAALTFNPVKLPRKPTPIYVPARTKVAGEGKNGPIVFETARDLALTDLELKKVIAFDPVADLYGENSSLAAAGAATLKPLFAANRPVPHEFYLGCGCIFAGKGISELRLSFRVSGGSPRRSIQWWIPAKDGRTVLSPSRDTTEQLTRNGDVVFANLPEWAPVELMGQKSWWLGCRLLDRLQGGERAGKATTGRQLRIESITISAAWEVKEGELDAAFFNNLPIDLSKDFYPLGPSPRFGDVFYVKSDVFSTSGSKVRLGIQLTNPASAGKGSPIPAAGKLGRPGIAWEYWDGRRWSGLDCKDETEALTEGGNVSFTMPSALPATVNGVEGGWLRARLVTGSYEGEVAGPGAAPPAPPSIKRLTVISSAMVGPEDPGFTVTNNNLAFEKIVTPGSFPPFQPSTETGRFLYLGFNASGFGHRGLPLDIFFNLDGRDGRIAVRSGPAKEPPSAMAWQYYSSGRWKDARMDDDTLALTRSGIITVWPGEDMTPWAEFSPEPGTLYWLRASWKPGGYGHTTKACGILLNTVAATQTTTIEKELLGSSNGRPNQVFRTAQVPVLRELQLQVREPGMPPSAELEKLRREEGDDILAISRDPRGNIEQIWVRWHEVGDFLSSGHSDRHFMVERESGEIRFGDGITGLIPAAGANNIRLARYLTGGGAAGNQPSGGIAQLRSTVPYVDSVVNHYPATGGQNIEAWASVRERGARWLRHRGCAVTVEDYEDLARAASPKIARAKCYPNRDLAADPGGRQPVPGLVSVVIVPHGKDPAPLPDLALLRIVDNYLNKRKSPDAGVVLLAPEYVRVSLEIAIVPTVAHTGAGLIRRCEEKLIAFLHPVTGGPEGEGWEFGRCPGESDFYGLLESIRGLDFIRSLRIAPAEERHGLLASGIFLVCSGEHRILLGA